MTYRNRFSEEYFEKFPKEFLDELLKKNERISKEISEEVLGEINDKSSTSLIASHSLREAANESLGGFLKNPLSNSWDNFWKKIEIFQTTLLEEILLNYFMKSVENFLNYYLGKLKKRDPWMECCKNLVIISGRISEENHVLPIRADVRIEFFVKFLKETFLTQSPNSISEWMFGIILQKNP